jgi:2,2-dialkylglycine decarboxylase (pyruvate)
MLSGCWCSVLGHNHPEFVRNLKRQVGHLTHLGTGYLSEEVADGAAALLSTLSDDSGETGGPPADPGDYRVAFVNTGSEAVDLAVKFAKAATGRQGVISFERGYYGASTSVYHYMGLPKKEFMGSIPGCHQVLAPDCDACPVGATHPGCAFACLEVSERRLEAAGVRDGSIAAVLFEPIISAGGMVFPPAGYLERLAETARRLGALLISNEVTTGAGRTGRWHAYQHSRITPDAIAFGKGFGNGLPVAGVLVKAEVEEAAHSAGLVHIQSHQSDPLSGFVVAEVVRLIRELGLLERARVMGEELKAKLERVALETGSIRAVRGLGLMVGFTAVTDGAALHADLSSRGIVTCYRPAYATFQLMPAYIITSRQIDHFVKALAASLRTPLPGSVCAGGGEVGCNDIGSRPKLSVKAGESGLPVVVGEHHTA